MQRVLSIPFIFCHCFDKNKQTQSFGYRNHWSLDSVVSQFGQPVFSLPSILPQDGLVNKVLRGPAASAAFTWEIYRVKTLTWETGYIPGVLYIFLSQI